MPEQCLYVLIVTSHLVNHDNEKREQEEMGCNFFESNCEHVTKTHVQLQILKAST